MVQPKWYLWVLKGFVDHHESTQGDILVSFYGIYVFQYLVSYEWSICKTHKKTFQFPLLNGSTLHALSNCRAWRILQDNQGTYTLFYSHHVGSWCVFSRWLDFSTFSSNVDTLGYYLHVLYSHAFSKQLNELSHIHIQRKYICTSLQYLSRALKTDVFSSCYFFLSPVNSVPAEYWHVPIPTPDDLPVPLSYCWEWCCRWWWAVS